MNRGRAEYDDLTPAERAQRLGRAGAPALGVRLSVDAEGEVLAASNVVMAGYWEQPEQTAEAIHDGWFHTGDGGIDRRRALPHDRRPQEGRDHLRRRERVVDRSRGLHLLAPGRGRGRGGRRPAREVGRDGDGARGRRAGRDARPRTRSSSTAAPASRTSSARPRSSSATRWRAPQPASSRSSSCARPTGKDATASSTERSPACAPGVRFAGHRAWRLFLI